MQATRLQLTALEISSTIFISILWEITLVRSSLQLLGCPILNGCSQELLCLTSKDSTSNTVRSYALRPMSSRILVRKPWKPSTATVSQVMAFARIRHSSSQRQMAFIPSWPQKETLIVAFAARSCPLFPTRRSRNSRTFCSTSQDYWSTNCARESKHQEVHNPSTCSNGISGLLSTWSGILHLASHSIALRQLASQNGSPLCLMRSRLLRLLTLGNQGKLPPYPTK